MAWLEHKGNLFRIRFRFGGRKLVAPLKTEKEKEANGWLARFEENLRLAERGRLEIPADADVGLFLLSDGKINRRPQEEDRAKPATLSELFAGYRDNYPKAAKEDNTRYTERLHMAHLERLLGARTKLHAISAKTLQAYVTARSQEKSKRGTTICSRTIKKELGTLTVGYPTGTGVPSAADEVLGVRQGEGQAPIPDTRADRTADRQRWLVGRGTAVTLELSVPDSSGGRRGARIPP